MDDRSGRVLPTHEDDLDEMEMETHRGEANMGCYLANIVNATASYMW